MTAPVKGLADVYATIQAQVEARRPMVIVGPHANIPEAGDRRCSRGHALPARGPCPPCYALLRGRIRALQDPDVVRGRGAT